MSTHSLLHEPLAIDAQYGLVIHRNFIPLFANDAYAHCFGYNTGQEILALPSLLSLIAEHEQDTAKTAYQRVMTGLDQPGVRTFENLNKDGELITVLTVDSVVDWQGEPAMQIIVVDLSRQMAIQRQLLASEQRYRELVDGSIQGMLVHKDFQPLFCNQAYAHMYGFTDANALLAQPSILPFINTQFHVQAWLDNQALLAGKVPVIKTEAKGLRADTSVLWLSLLSRPVDWNGERAVQVTAMDITEQHDLREQLEYRANFDGLTNVLNRRALSEHLQQQLKSAITRRRPLSCLLIDIDNFKAINDSFGHHAGDVVLQHFAKGCQQLTRQHDLLGRWGGEEFVLVLPGTPVQQAQQIAERLCCAMANLDVPVGSLSIHFTVSIGVAALSSAIQSIEQLVGSADVALYDAKHRGKGQVVVAEVTAPCLY